MSAEYLRFGKTQNLPRLPLEGNIDLTYRCNNNCRHCWLRIPADSPDKKYELSFAQIKRIAQVSKENGCRRWSLSGGEPLLRPDFSDIFDYLTTKCNSYSINTNGTLITPKIARLFKRKGVKMVALYGASAQVHDHITRNPGSYEAAIRGFAYLKEAGAGFMVQLIPMRDNYHQFPEMVKLAQSLSRHYRVGAPWLYLSASGDLEKNKEIIRQRLLPHEVVELDKPDFSYSQDQDLSNFGCQDSGNKQYLFSGCIPNRKSFFIDPYGKMTFCSFIKDPELRYDLKRGSFQKAWDEFIPSLANKIKVRNEKQNCANCASRQDCRNCPVYSYLEHRNYNKKVSYLCAVTKENRKFKKNWLKNHRRYFKIADITIQLDSDLPIDESTFDSKFKHFTASGPGKDNISIRHHFSLPDLKEKFLGKEVYRRPPWAIYKNNDNWIYLGIFPSPDNKGFNKIAVFNQSYTRVRIYNNNDFIFKKGKVNSLTLFPTDQIFLARILANRSGCYLHSCGVNFNGQGLLFVGHSEAGKSTIARMLKGQAEILCDDRIIVRNKNGNFKIYGTWSHGDVPDVSSGSAPLKAILFLEKSKNNCLIPIQDKKEITRKVLTYLIRPFETVDWWEKTLLVVEEISNKIPCYTMQFDQSGKIVDQLKKI